MIAAAGFMSMAFNDQSYITFANATVNAVINGPNLEHSGILTETCDIARACSTDQVCSLFIL